MNLSKSTPATVPFTLSHLYETKDHVRKLHTFSKVILATSSFFWLWAAYNTKFKMKTHFDSGMISFFLSGSSSIYLYIKTKNGVNEFTSTGSIGRLLVTLTHIIVVANYALGAYLACSAGNKIYVSFATYCFIFMFLWSFSAYTCWRLITNTIDIGVEEGEEEEEVLVGLESGYGNDYDDDENDYVYDDYSIDSPVSNATEDAGGVIRRW